MEDCGHIPEWGGQRVERVNARGRHRYCAAFKEWIVGQALKPGMSGAGLAMRNQVNANQLRRWVLVHKQRTQAASAPRLLPVTLAAESAPAIAVNRPPFIIEIELGGALVRVHEGVNACALRTVLDVLRGVVR